MSHLTKGYEPWWPILLDKQQYYLCYQDYSYSKDVCPILEGKQSIVLLISKIFQNTLADDESMETTLNSMWQKANAPKTPGQPLKDPLTAIAMEILRLPTYSPLRTILMATDDKLT